MSEHAPPPPADRTERLIEWILPPAAEPLSCPRCKRAPRLVQNDSL